ncbi:MAG TPA: hypothetical protein VHU77_11390 [Candidatus Limnocylindria bacterium]|nr:hypothetical protein [Candidatus Limnocylindria bacterium]
MHVMHSSKWLARAALERLTRIQAIRAVVERRFERADDKQRIPTRTVALVVGAEMGEPVNPPLYRDIAAAVKPLGWLRIKPKNRPQWRGVRAR